MDAPQAQATDSAEHARRMFRAVLAPWAADLLELRRRGLDRPGFRRGLDLPLLAVGADHRTRITLPTGANRSRRRAA